MDYAGSHNKIAAFTETGDRNSDANAGLYWKNVVLPGIMEDPTGKSKKIAWVLTWINSSWSEPYVPHSGSSATVKQSFVDFKSSPYTLFGDEIGDLYSYIPVQSIAVAGNNNISIIDEPEGTLQMVANITPVDATFSSVAWRVNDSDIATIDALGVVRAVADGVVTVRATANDGSGAFGETQVTISNQVVTNIEEESILRFGIAPNPVISDLTISNAHDIRQVTLFDTKGKSLRVIVNSQDNVIIPMGDLPAGLYLLKVVDKDDYRYVQRLVKYR